MPLDNPTIRIKKLTDVSDQIHKVRVMRDILKTVEESMTQFQNAYQPRRDELLEINALYRNKSFANRSRSEWQTKTFIPLFFRTVESRTSILHEALWGNRIASPYTVLGKTAEDHKFAVSAETLLNNTMDNIGFYEESEECLRNCTKYGLGVYRYGWENRTEDRLVREPARDDKGEIDRKDDGTAKYRYKIMKHAISRPFIRSIDVVDNIGWDPSARRWTPRACEWIYEIREEAAESIKEKEDAGEYDVGSFTNLIKSDPHGIEGLGLDTKKVQLRQDESLEDVEVSPKRRYAVVDWYGWFDVDGDGVKEFIRISIADKRVILNAQEIMTGEYPFIDVQHSRSVHSITPWGSVDPVVHLQYEINELHNQRGDANKFVLNPQMIINVDKILEDHAYISTPGALHPFSMGDEPINNALQPLTFQFPNFISQQEESININHFNEGANLPNVSQLLGSLNRTPASSIISVFNAQQSTNSMIVNGILNSHGELGQRILRFLQLYGDETFILRTAGRRGVDFLEESLENILGEFDVKVTTSSFFGNREIELQRLIQLRPMWADAQHIDLIELDRSILENVLPKRADRILNVPEDPLSPIEEQLFFMAGSAESVTISPLESVADLRTKLQLHQSFKGSKAFEDVPDMDKEEFERHLERIADRVDELQTQRLLQQQQATRGLPEGGTAPDGNLNNTGLPSVRATGNAVAPKLNNLQ